MGHGGFHLGSGKAENNSRSSSKMITEEQIQRNLRAVARAIAQQELEGLSVPDETIADLHRVACGEIDTAEVIRNIHSRISNVALLRK